MKHRATYRRFSAVAGKLTVKADDHEILNTLRDSIIPHWLSAFVGNKKYLVIADYNGNLEYFNGTQWSSTDHVMRQTVVQLICVQNDYLVYDSRDKQIEVWNMSTDKRVFELNHYGEVLCVQIYDNFIITGDQDQTIQIWNLNEKIESESWAGANART